MLVTRNFWKMQRRFWELVRQNLTILAKISLIDVFQGCKHACEMVHILPLPLLSQLVYCRPFHRSHVGKVQNLCLFYYNPDGDIQKQPPEVFCKKRCFLVDFAKFLRPPFLQNTSGRLLLYIQDLRSTRI